MTPCPPQLPAIHSDPVIHCDYDLQHLRQEYLRSSIQLGLDLHDFDCDFNAFDAHHLQKRAEEVALEGGEEKKKGGFYPGTGKDWR
jgi:hypothetical protein